MSEHLVFYDGECGFCDHVVHFLLKVDKKKRFVFAPLKGITAERFLETVPNDVKQADSLILVEAYQTNQRKIFIFGKAVFRIAWLLGGGWKGIGLFFYLPAFLYDGLYRLVARHRHQLFNDSCSLPDPQFHNRFLP